MYNLPESLRTDDDYEQQGGLVYRACKVDLNEMLTVVDVAINARNESFKYLLKKLYFHIEKKNSLYQRQESVIEEHFREINKLQAHVRRVKDEKIEAKELYDFDIAGFKAQILILQEQINRVNTRIEENEAKCKKEMNTLQQTIVRFRSHVDMLTSEKQRAEETMNERYAVNTRRQAKELKSQVREIAKKKKEIEKLHLMQIKVFKTNINRLKTVYDRLYRRFLSKVQMIDKSMGANERRSEEEIQGLLDALEECERQLKISQEHKDTLQEEMNHFDAEYKKLREKEMVLTDSNKYLQKMIEQSEKQLKEHESEIERRQDLDEKQAGSLSKYENDVENLRSKMTELKEAFEAKQLTLDTLQTEMAQFKECEVISKDDAEHLLFLENEYDTLYEHLQLQMKYATELPIIRKQYEELNAAKEALLNNVIDQKEQLLDHRERLEIATAEAERQIRAEFDDGLQRRSSKYLKVIDFLQKKLLEEKQERKEAEEEYQNEIRSLNVTTVALQDELSKLHRKHLL